MSNLPNPNAKNCPSVVYAVGGFFCRTWSLDGDKRIWVFIPNNED